MRLVPIVLITACAITPLAAVEQRPHGGDRAAEGGQARERAADRPRVREADGDGRVPREVLVRFDADKDGALNDAERAAAKDALRQHRERCDVHPEGRERLQAELLERFDADKDGKLSEAERTAAKAAREQIDAEREARLKAEHPELFARIDRNHDGTIDRGEREAWHAQHCRCDGGPDGKGHGHGHGEGHRPGKER